MTPEERQMVRDLFAKYDADHSGDIDFSELRRAVARQIDEREAMVRSAVLRMTYGLLHVAFHSWRQHVSTLIAENWLKVIVISASALVSPAAAGSLSAGMASWA